MSTKNRKELFANEILNAHLVYSKLSHSLGGQAPNRSANPFLRSSFLLLSLKGVNIREQLLPPHGYHTNW